MFTQSPYMSFDEPVPPPSTDGEGDFCVTFDVKWLPYLIGALKALVAYQTWSSDADRAVAEAGDLIGLFMEGVECDMTGVLRYGNALPFVGTVPYLSVGCDDTLGGPTTLTDYRFSESGVSARGASPSPYVAVWHNLENGDERGEIVAVVDGAWEINQSIELDMQVGQYFAVWGLTTPNNSDFDCLASSEVDIAYAVSPQAYGDFFLPVPKLGDLRLNVPTDKLQIFGTGNVWEDV